MIRSRNHRVPSVTASSRRRTRRKATHNSGARRAKCSWSAESADAEIGIHGGRDEKYHGITTELPRKSPRKTTECRASARLSGGLKASPTYCFLPASAPRPLASGPSPQPLPSYYKEPMITADDYVPLPGWEGGHWMTLYTWGRVRQFPRLPAPEPRLFGLTPDTRVLADCYWQPEPRGAPRCSRCTGSKVRAARTICGASPTRPTGAAGTRCSSISAIAAAPSI